MRRLHAFALAVALSVTASLGLGGAGCSSPPCQDGTLFVTVELGAWASQVASLDTEVSLDGGPARTLSFSAKRALGKTESLEIVLPKGAAHPALALTVIGRGTSGIELTRSAPLAEKVSGTCLALTVSLPGGPPGSGGGTGAGGATGTGGVTAGTGGGTGAGGTGGSPVCAGAGKCMGTTQIACEVNGQWQEAAMCGAHATCMESGGKARCACVADATCAAVGDVCAEPTRRVLCRADNDGCVYTYASERCAKSCSGGTCCVDACTAGARGTDGCGMRECQTGPDGCTFWASLGCPASQVCERHGGPVCLDASWAAWPMPRSSTDAAGTRPAFTDNGDGTITDTITKLMWVKSMVRTSYSQGQARAYCPTLLLGGFSDWRLPTLIELFSLVDHGVQSPAINATYFPATPASAMWSSTPVPGSPNLGWLVNFADGSTTTNNTWTGTLVRCVR